MGVTRRGKFLRSGWIAALAVIGLAGTQSLAGADVADGDWPNFGRTGLEQHYSPLDEVSLANVADLKLAWHFDLEPGYTASAPIAAEGKLFISTGHSHIRAFDSATGDLLWEFDGRTRELATNAFHLGWGNKGIAYGEGRIAVATTDGRVIALDAETGKQLWETRQYEPTELRNGNGAPRIYDGKVIIGHGGADVTPLRGYVTAYDLETGEQAWRFYTVPGGDPAQPAGSKAEEVMRATWPGGWTNPDGTRRGGGGTMWNAFSHDPELGLIYLGVGNGFPYNQDMRSPGGGDNLFLASIVAVKADTGEYVWHYQVCPGEQWDCTATANMSIGMVEIDGKPRKVLMQAPKNGFFYVLDAATGEYISAEKIARVTWAERIDENGRPVEVPGIRYQNAKVMFEMWPGPTGAHSWLPQAFSPRTGLVYIPVTDSGALVGPGELSQDPMTRNMGMALIPDAFADQIKGYLKAWNPVTQKPAWVQELPGSWVAGVLATAGDLVFQGRLDKQFVAYDARSGKPVWSFATQAPVLGPPISYSKEGKQYIAVMTGNTGTGAGIQSAMVRGYDNDYRAPRRLLVFALGGKDTVPPAPPSSHVALDDPGFTPDPKLAQAGAMQFGQCSVCHGINAYGGGAAPDLRYSPMILDAATFRAVVKEGALKPNGMPDYPQIDDDTLEAMRHFLRTKAQTAAAEDAADRKARETGAPLPHREAGAVGGL